jgi:leucyl-tRNA synthetase
MGKSYDPSSVESKWQKHWREAGVHHADFLKAKKPYYNLVMFPYPSGDKLHIGHWYNFAPADSHGRFLRMRGHDVFEPMGFDAFGLPAENYAIKTGVPPAESTAKNIETMIAQLTRMGCMYDWDAMVNTSSPEYYRWTQWLFLEMYKNQLAYKKEAPVNWCPSCQTVLANEQAQDGSCERCGTAVVQKHLAQWFWNTRKYAERLLDGLDDLEWPEKTKAMQRNWIGKSQGAEVRFTVDMNEEHPRWESPDAQPEIAVFTTRPDTLFGATYMVLAPEHPLVDTITHPRHRGEIERYREQTQKKTDMQRTELNKEKSGVFTGTFAINPVTGDRIPIWVADYVLVNYGTGAVMAVPAHDERDWEFAKKHDLPVRVVVAGGTKEDEVFTGDGTAVNSGFIDGLSTPEAKKRMIAWLEDEEKGRCHTTYRLRDWLVSRQRYWGAPIPIVYDPEGKAHPIPEEHLPWLLPTDVEFKPTGESPLKHSKEFIERTEKIFGKGWRPEFDTMDTFVCSSFYYLRYLSCHPEPDEGRHETSARHNTLIDPKIERNWMPVDMYIGGPEHACMHLIYARFVMMALKDFGYVSNEEPFKKLVHQGLITNKGAKMSKSKGNVVSPDSFVDRYGSDVFRMFLMFMGPFTDGGDWNDTGIKGVDRFVQRLWNIVTEKVEPQDQTKNKSTKIIQEVSFERMLHRTVQRVTQSMETMHFNTAISALMEMTNALEKQGAISADTMLVVARLLSPLAPHLAEEIWEKLGGKGFVMEQEWPKFDSALLEEEKMTIVVQVNGKLRGSIEIDRTASPAEIIALAKAQDNVAKFIADGIKKEIYVPGKLVSFVI